MSTLVGTPQRALAGGEAFREAVSALMGDAERLGDYELASVCRLALKGNSAALHEIREALRCARGDVAAPNQIGGSP